MSKTNGKREMPKPERRGGKIALIALGAVAALVLATVGIWKLVVVPPDVSLTPVPGTGLTKPNETTNNGTTAGETTSPDDEEPVDLNGRKKDYFTFILLGKDTGGGGNTDTMIMVSYDVPNGTMDLVSIPRDTMINVPWKIKKINAVFASSRGVEGLKEELGHLTGVTPDFYVAVEWEAIGEIVDALGGVWFDVPYNMNYDDPDQDLYIHQEKGYRFLDGDDAMQVIRWRKNNGEEYGIGDSGRQQVQQDFLKAVAKQCLQIKNWTRISAFAEIFFKNVETDIPWNNVLWFAQQAMGMNVDNINFHALPGNDQGWYYTPSIGGNLAYFFADPTGIVELVNAHFNPFNREITENDLQIVYKNKDASLGVTNGELADPKMAIPSVKPPSPPKTETEEKSEGGETGQEGTENSGAGEAPNPPPENGESGESDTGTGGETTAPPGGESGEGENTEPPTEDPASGEAGDGEPAPDGGGTEIPPEESTLPPEEPTLPPEEPMSPPEGQPDPNGSGEQTE